MTSLKALDRGIGQILQALAKNGLDQNTLVICTTDHGIAFPAMKCNLTDHGIGVMLIMRGPGGFSGGKVSDALISQVDIYPTICELLGITPPERLQGRSFMPIVRGEKEEVNEAIYAEINYHCQYEPVRAVRTKRWKYIRRFLDRNTPLLANTDASPSKELWLKNGFAELPVAREALYDLIFDPNEANNLAEDPSKKEILDDMRERLHRWMQETNDPLLDGEVPLPPGAVVNNPDDLDPHDIWKYTERPKDYV